MELTDTETYPTENHQYNGATPSLVTQPFLLHSPLIDTLVALDKPLSRPCIKTGDATILVRAGDLTDVNL